MFKTRNMCDRTGCFASISWKIVNFSLNNLKEREGVISPTFHSEKLKFYKFYIGLYSKGLYQRMYCKLESDDKNMPFSYVLELSDCDGKILSSCDGKKEEKYTLFSNLQKLMKENELEDYLKKCKEDTFVIRCHLYKVNCNQTPTLWKAITEYQEHKCSFQVEPELSNFAGWKKDISVPFTTLGRLHLRLTADEQKLLIDAQSLETKSSSVFYRFVIYILSDDRKMLQKCESGPIEREIKVSDFQPFKFFFDKRQALNSTVCSFTILFKVTLWGNDLNLTLDSYSIGNPNHSCYRKLACNHPTAELANDLRAMLLNELHCDVKLRTGCKVFPAHKNLLSARSPVFSAMFQHDMLETETGIVDVPDVDGETLQSFLEYLYTASIEMTHHNQALKLMIAADKYEVNSLKERCSQWLKSQLSVDNVYEVISVAEMLNQQDLKSSSIQFIRDNKKKIFSSPDWSEWMQNNLKLATDTLMTFVDD